MGDQESHAPQPGPTASATLRVSAADLRWCCDEAWLPCASTDEVEPLTGVVGQDDALQALRFGLEMPGPGQHVFVRGLAGGSNQCIGPRVVEPRGHLGGGGH